MKNKKAIEMTFNWIFAIIVGGFILFIAIYGAGKLIRTSEQSVYTETAASLVSLFDPLETGLASGKASEISFNKKSRIFLDCEEQANPPFGRQTISFSEQTFGTEFGETGSDISIKDKYVFAEEVLEGKKMYYFSKPFFMGFKVSDLLMMYGDTKQYCVYNSPEDFKDDIEALHLPLIIFPNSSEKCDGIKVCFNQGSCDIKISENEKSVLKQGRKMYYDGDLIYGAIFSSPDMYECNIKRIKQRYNELAKIYLEKIEIIERLECEPQIGVKLAEAINTEITNSRELNLFFTIVEDIDSINKRAKDGCKIYYNVNFER